MRTTVTGEVLLKEALRKSIHVTIVFVPALADWNSYLTVTLLCTGILFYLVNETARNIGVEYGLISRITAIASRSTEQGFLWGPITLGLGALTAMLFYPDPAARLAVYALAFGDGVASFIGKLWGRHSIPWPGNKTLVGSLACFTAVFISSYLYLHTVLPALLTAAVATFLELIPIKDFDNIIIPAGTGFILYFVYNH